MIVMIGWRGHKKINDEPQHLLQGESTTKILKVLKQKFDILSGNKTKDFIKVNRAINFCKKFKAPFFLIIKKNTFKPQKKTNSAVGKNLELSREQVLKIIIQKLDNKYKFVSTTGKCSRELYEIRKKKGGNFDFYNVGAMGHVSQIALGISLYSKKKIICFDGDGSLLMHLGGMTTIGQSKSKKLVHILLNNFCHDSVGGQPTAAKNTIFTKIAKASGYNSVYGPIKNEKNLINIINKLDTTKGPTFVEIYINRSSRDSLARPKRDLKSLKIDFQKNL